MKYFNNFIQFEMIVFMSMILLSCSNNDDNECLSLKQCNSSIPIEGYVPVGTSHLVTLRNGLQVNIDQDSIYYLGDIIFSKEQIDSLGNIPIKDTRSAVLKNYVSYWPDFKVPYEISSDFSSLEIKFIEDAIKMISQNSSLEFVKATSKDFHKIYIYKDGQQGLYSYDIGMNPTGINRIHLDDSFGYGNVMHEIMHCLGFFHEQSRSDRDENITILWNNILSGKTYEHQFEKYTDGYDSGPFDTESIMMYPSYADSKNGEPTILTINNNIIPAQRTHLSSGDVQGLNFLYGPKIMLNTVTIYDDGNSSSDPGNRNDNFSNNLYFVSKNGEPVTLKYPRLVVVKYCSMYQGSSVARVQNTEDLNYIIIPSGVSSYALPDTHCYISSGQEGVEQMDVTGYSLVN